MDKQSSISSPHKSLPNALLFILAVLFSSLWLASCQPATSGFGNPHPLLGDVRVRRGIAYCTNRAALFHAVYPWVDNSEPFVMDALLPTVHLLYQQLGSDFSRYPFDPERGQALFEEAGWKLIEGATYRTNVQGQEMTLTLITTLSQFRQTWTTAFAEQMAACGLRVERVHVPAEEFFAEGGILSQREFDLAALATRHSQSNGSELSEYRCDRIPTAENNWQGDNFSGWCNPKFDLALQHVQNTLLNKDYLAAYRILQREYSDELPGLPLFSRVETCVTQPNLMNFVPTDIFTWNAAQWTIPGRDVIVIGSKSEPVSLYEPGAFIADLIRAMVFGTDVVRRDFLFQPVMLKHLPSVENGEVLINTIEVRAGTTVVDAHGTLVEVNSGTRIQNAKGEEVEYTGGTVEMRQLTVTYEFVDGLMWSDGVPVSRRDYALAYRLLCEFYQSQREVYPIPLPRDYIEKVDFSSDTSYQVTWKPGYQGWIANYPGPAYFEPPIGRLPAHYTLEDGRKLAEISTSEWIWLMQEVKTPPAAGPYSIARWESGKEIVFTANPFYYQGPPATSTIVIRFIPQNETANHFLRGEVDVLCSDSLMPEHIEMLLPMQEAGTALLYFYPSPIYEYLAFHLWEVR
ncbi:MAG: ABC transporter substrate-binding protein [Anaerolineales bacterium]|nr:ABC transporter substrate-binding protein [Anaerolineales bacterium]